MEREPRYRRLVDLGIDVTWDTMLFGLLLRCLTSDEVQAFAQERLTEVDAGEISDAARQLALGQDLSLDEVRVLLAGLVSPNAPYEEEFGGGVALDKCLEPWRTEGRKWRVLMLHEALEKVQTSTGTCRFSWVVQALSSRCLPTREWQMTSKVLDDTETVWATFLYPNDMRHLIRYVPAKDLRKRRSPYRGSAAQLLLGVRAFLAEERAALCTRRPHEPAAPP